MLGRILLAVFVVTAAPALAAPAIELPEAAQQGALVVGRTDPGASVRVDGRDVRVSPAGLFLIAIGRDDSEPRHVTVTDPLGISNEATVSVIAREYDIQRIDGLPKKTVTPDPETATRIGEEIAAISEVRTLDTPRDDFAAGFQWPLTGTITGVYGSQRILNGNPRRPHFGVDIAAPEGTPVRAMGAGTVRLAHPDMVLTGQTLMVDHGHGLMSVYTHMSDIAVAEGSRVEAGDVIGAVGQTGRATGPHLHWGVTLFSVQLDPMLVAGPMPEG
ncbi:MAG: M23 family metallopeptidase [Rhodospirillales bacterium]